MSQRKRSKGLGSSQMTDGEEDFSPSQVERYSQDQVNQKVSELVQFLLVKDQKKMPIKKADMLKSVFGKYRSCKEYKDFYSEIVNKAGRTLQEVFGLQLVEIDTKCPTYILINNLPRAEGKYPCRDKEKEKMGLLLVILSFIFMKGNSVKDSALWEFLNLLRVYPGKQHRVFGDVRKLVTDEFVHQKPTRIQVPVGATGREGDLQEGCAELCGKDTGKGPHVLGKPVQRGPGHPLTPQNKGTPLVCSPLISRLSAWLYRV
ncbi:non-structural maintenance of chromosomes element 3 homolog isoform X1 [Corvus cornix cornix]|uniref:non-structural maintenance of chromosomes element 3 homolog isoform X1 n=1 Tax=Corvus brachyrhynchos TaxID=85066 RepID=UPI0008166826|nr:PREDICTED: non-structural maintenance of chromosomes element 3 homolog isoform X1 [Corvus brachyrhynchos]XP_039428460.1 non-structural maintenance of chromosomes element 3 homolog isoform X1 [Corvus cornix cornix]